MKNRSHENLKPIYFAGELLPDWTRMLNVAAGLCQMPSPTRQWFSRFTAGAGIDDARTILGHCNQLRLQIVEQRGFLERELRQSHDDLQAAKIIAAWLYALDTMIQVARAQKTCAWVSEDADDFTSPTVAISH